MDPNSVHNLIPLEVTAVFYDLTILIWLNCGYMLALYWYSPSLLRCKKCQRSHCQWRVGLLQKSGMQDFSSVQRLRPVMIILMIITSITLLPLGIMQVLVTTDLTRYSSFTFILHSLTVICIQFTSHSLVHLTPFIQSSSCIWIISLFIHFIHWLLLGIFAFFHSLSPSLICNCLLDSDTMHYWHSSCWY